KVKRLQPLHGAETAMPVRQPLPCYRAQRRDNEAHQRDGNQRLKERKSRAPRLRPGEQVSRPHRAGVFTRRTMSTLVTPPFGLSTRKAMICGVQGVADLGSKKSGQ